MRRLLPLLILLPLLLGPLAQPGGTSAAPVQQPPPGECWAYFVGGNLAQGGLIKLVLEVNQMSQACEYSAGFSDTATYLDAFTVESFVVPDQGATCARGFIYASTTYQGGAPPLYSSGNLGRVQLPDPIRIRLQPDFAQDGCGGPNYKARLTLFLFVQPARTATPTLSPTVTSTPTTANNPCAGQLIPPGGSCVVQVSGWDVVAVTCGGPPATWPITLRVERGATILAQDTCRFSPAVVHRADDALITITYYNTNPTDTGTILTTLDTYNDQVFIRGAPDGGGVYYQNGAATIKPLQNLDVVLPSPAAGVRASCLQNISLGGAPMPFSRALNGGAMTFLDSCRFGPTVDQTGASSVTWRYSNTSTIMNDTVTGSVSVIAISAFATATPTVPPTSSPTRTSTTTASPVQAKTPTSSPTRSPTAPTSTATATVTGTLPVAGDCAVGQTIGVPVAPATVTITLTVGLRFTVADQPVVVNIGSLAQTIAPGSYQWEQAAGAYTAYSLTTPARIKLCIAIEATATLAPPTPLPTYAPGEEPCVPATPIPADIPGTYPDLALVLPSWTPAVTITVTITGTATITATPGISLTAIVAIIGTASTGVISPVAAIQTATAPYSWASGEATAAGWAATIQPALDWLAIINPLNPSWDIEGGPLWALAPIIKPILPIIAISVLVALAGFLLFLLRLLLAAFDLILKLIEAVTP